MLFNKGFRDFIIRMFDILANYRIIITNSVMLIYMFVIVFFLDKLNCWDISLLKGTILWTLFVAFPLFFKANKANQDKYYFKILIKENLKIILILEFLTNLYVFNLIAELVFLPIMLVLGGMSAIAETKKSFLPAKKFVDYVFGILGIILIIFVFYNLINDFESFANIDNLKSFLLPFFLTILFLPAIYFQALYMNYDSTFTRLDFFCKDLYY